MKIPLSKIYKVLHFWLLSKGSIVPLGLLRLCSLYQPRYAFGGIRGPKVSCNFMHWALEVTPDASLLEDFKTLGLHEYSRYSLTKWELFLINLSRTVQAPLQDIMGKKFWQIIVNQLESSGTCFNYIKKN